MEQEKINIEKEIRNARISYLSLLAGGLDKWIINDKGEERKRTSLINCIGRYIDYLLEKSE